jgi:hypothetical protein
LPGHRNEKAATVARKTRSTELETRAARLRLPIRKKPYAVRIAPGIRLAYRRNETAGSWSVIVADGAGSSWMKSFGLADDHEDAKRGRPRPGFLEGSGPSPHLGERQ